VVCQGCIYVFGGLNQDGVLNKSEKYDPGSGVWTELAPMPSRRYQAMAVELDGGIYVLGGRAKYGVAKYDPDSETTIRKLAPDSETTIRKLPRDTHGNYDTIALHHKLLPGHP
jgi:N-acetylneuraminic acid mutarotase